VRVCSCPLCIMNRLCTCICIYIYIYIYMYPYLNRRSLRTAYIFIHVNYTCYVYIYIHIWTWIYIYIYIGLTPSARLTRAVRCVLAFTRYCYTSMLLCTIQSSVHWPLPPALPALLQYRCTSIAQYTTPSQPPVLYAIHHIILA